MKTDPGKSCPHKIVIVGGGFAGVSAYRILDAHRDCSFEILIVSDDEMFAHIPLIHEVATFALPADVVTWPLSRYISCPGSEFLHGRVMSVDADKKCITVKTIHDERMTVSFDWLILATGSVPALPHIPGAETHLLPLRTLSDAKKIKEHILERFRNARVATTREERKEQLTFVCVGAGPTGIEIVGEFSDLFSKELARQYPECCEDVRIVLLNNKEHITIGGHPWFGEMAEMRLANLPRVEVLHTTQVLSVTERGVETNHGFIPSRTVLWTGGVAGVFIPTTAQPPVSHDDHGRILVTSELSLEGQGHIFVVGDTAHIPKQGGESYGMQAQFAVREGKHAAKNILRMLRGKKPLPFEARERGFLVPIGKHYGLAEIFGVRFSGILAWHVAHIIYVFSVVRWDLKLQVAWKWLYYLMCRRKTV